MTMLEQSLDAGVNVGAMRAAMVSSQLRTTGVDDVRVVGAMATAAREDFVPAASRGLAYRDTAIPLGHGRYLNPPLATARLLTQAQVLKHDRVLLIGAATGYAAAVVAMLGASVVAVEEDAGLLAAAREALDGVEGIELVEAPLAAGHPVGAPYDVLLVDGAVDALPDVLVAQLRPGGRIATGRVDHGVTRLTSGTRTEGGSGLFAFADAECVVLPGFAPVAGFTFG